MESTFIQDTLTDNKKIFDRILVELTQAKTEILVAMAWFTDPELFDVLKSRLGDGLSVSIILSEQADNEKLDFALLEGLGAEVIRVKNVGYGMMHQKFCIIDRKLAISGSYNWSVNARTNNHESVIVTNYEKTVGELVEVFENIKERSSRLSGGETLDDILKFENIAPAPIPAGSANKQEPKSILEQTIFEFKDVLDTVFAAEVGNFDKELLREAGYTRARDNNGDSQILPQAMDSVYSNFINDIEVIDERKKKLMSKVDEQQKLSSGNLDSKIAFEEIRLNEENRLHVENAKKDIINLESAKESLNKDLKNNNEVRIPFIKEAIQALNEKIAYARRDFIKPDMNWPLFSVCLFVALGLAAYIFVFYTSVAYIFVFSKQDANEMQAMQVVIETPEIFDAHAFEKIVGKGLGGYLFMFLFVIVPYGLGLLKLFAVEQKKDEQKGIVARWFAEWRGLILIALVDSFIAYKVTKNINFIERMTNQTREELRFYQVFLSENFWLVFIMGSLGIFLFKVAVDKLFDMRNERSASLAENQSLSVVEGLQHQINAKQEEINTVLMDNHDLQSRLALSEKEIEKKRINLENLPLKRNDAINLLKQEQVQGRERLQNLANIYKSYIENDKLPISISALEDRINVFLEGWSKYLHDIFSMAVAEKKTAEAIAEIEDWKNLKRTNSNLAN